MLIVTTPLPALPTELSYPKDKIKILLLENIHPAAVRELQRAGYGNVEALHTALKAEALAEKLAEAHIVGIRSKTQLTEPLLRNAKRLMGIGAFCIGTDQIDLRTATELGIVAFNSPFSSTRSVAELVIGAAIFLQRGIADKSAAAHRGEWLKKADGAHEVRGKTIGIVGYGRIGSQVGLLAEALNMQVQFYDVVPKLQLGGARPAPTLAELLATSDIVTLHVPDDATTQKLINAERLAQMKSGAMLINYARGRVIDAAAVADAIRSGRLGGAAVDVFETEPRGDGDKFANPLQGLPNVILSPHIGGSTEEAQENIGIDVAQKLVNYLDRGVTIGSVTVPELNLPQQAGAHRLLHIHHNRPGILGEINTYLSQLGINIVGQYLKTNEQIGYVVLDVEKGQTEKALEAIKNVKHTIRARSLY
jgi:D-3-phosphoglycerate dehydrogenase